MKKLNNIPQIILVAAIAVLLVAVGFLFYLQCKGTCNVDSSKENTAATVAKINSSIAYVNLDTLVSEYQMTKDMSDEIQVKGKQMEADLSQKNKNFQAAVQDFQYKAKNGLELSSKLQDMQQKLAAEEQNLYKLRETYTGQMQEENAVMLRKVMSKIMDYLKEYNKGKNFHFILGNTFDGKILYANPSLDITKDVLKGINLKYSSEKKETGK